jgi:hypothetical protein
VFKLSGAVKRNRVFISDAGIPNVDNNSSGITGLFLQPDIDNKNIVSQIDLPTLTINPPILVLFFIISVPLNPIYLFRIKI